MCPSGWRQQNALYSSSYAASLLFAVQLQCDCKKAAMLVIVVLNLIILHQKIKKQSSEEARESDKGAKVRYDNWNDKF